ncbi:MAG: hypothetical protein P8Y10_04190 [Gemmatimonadales bacterium]|jgi:hypothetical protein
MSRFGVSKSQRAFSAVALLLAVLYIAAGLSVWLGVWNPNEFARSLWGLGGLLAGVLILLGVWVQESSPVVGALLAFGGALPLAILFAWTLLPPVLTFLMILLWARARGLEARAKKQVAARAAETTAFAAEGQPAEQRAS